MLILQTSPLGSFCILNQRIHEPNKAGLKCSCLQSQQAPHKINLFFWDGIAQMAYIIRPNKLC